MINRRGVEVTSPLDACKEFCFECCGYDRTMVKNCNSTLCSLHPFRNGTNPYRKKIEYTEEQKEAMRDRMSKARESKS